MNVFEKNARMAKYSGIVSAWVAFVAALAELFEAYRAENPRTNATLVRQVGTSVLITFPMGQFPGDPFSLMTVSVSARIVESEVTINCRIQRWHGPPGAHPLAMDTETVMDFVLDGDGLVLDRQKFTIFKAAEKLLSDALML